MAAKTPAVRAVKTTIFVYFHMVTTSRIFNSPYCFLSEWKFKNNLKVKVVPEILFYY